MPTLYYLSGACSIVPHTVVRELQLDIIAKAAPRANDAGRAEYLEKITSLGKVPALLLDDGQVITQNIAIVEYLAAQGERQGKAGVVYPKLGSLEHAQALRWLSFANSDIHPEFAPLFGPQRFSDDENSYPMIKRMAMDSVLKLYAVVDHEYKSKDWIANNQYSAADIYIYVTCRWALGMGFDLTPYDGLVSMLNRIQKRPALIQVLEEQGIRSI